MADIVMLAEEYSDDMSPIGWHLSEKIDGFRAVWNGESLVSRKNNRFKAPDWFTRGLPSTVQIDGELSAGRKKFQRTASIVKGPHSNAWNDLTYFVFDIVAKTVPFEERQELLQKFIKQIDNPRIQYVPQTLCQSKEFFEKSMQAVLSVHGEGLILRKAKSMYTTGRSAKMLKAKPWYDAEATVVRYEEGQNSFTGKMGALVCKTKNGLEITVGTGFTIKQRASPPVIGTVITFRYRKLSDSGKPVHPAFVRVYVDT